MNHEVNRFDNKRCLSVVKTTVSLIRLSIIHVAFVVTGVCLCETFYCLCFHLKSRLFCALVLLEVRMEHSAISEM